METSPTAEKSVPQLPLEVWMEIIEQVCHLTGPPRSALHRQHPATGTLLSISRACWALRKPAMDALYCHCCYIDERSRLEGIVQSFGDHSTSLGRGGRGVQHLLLDFKGIGEAADVMPWVCELLKLVGPSLRTLILDWERMDERAEWNEEEDPSWQALLPRARSLYAAFAKLKKLEVFCSPVTDHVDPLMSTYCLSILSEAPNVWIHWDSLQTLVLCDIVVEYTLVWELASLPELKTLVLASPIRPWKVDFKFEWANAAGASRPLNVFVLDVEHRHKPLFRLQEWTLDDPVQILTVNVPLSYYGDENPTTAACDWAIHLFKQGRYNEWEGNKVLSTPS